LILRQQEKLDYEVELGLFIGKKIKATYEREKSAAPFFGYLIINECFARDWQFP